MFTASHNPAQYNGIKMCRAGAAPVGQDTGLADIRALVERWSDEGAPTAGRRTPGTVTRRDVLGDYAAHLRGLVDLSGIRPLKVVVDAGNGMGGHTVPTVFEGLPLELDADVLRAGRHVPQPRGQPAGPEEHRRPPGTGARDRRRPRPRLRRRRRPLLRRRRERRPGHPVRDHRPGRRPRTGQAPRRHGHPQPDHLLVGARGRQGERRQAGPHPRRTLLHQGGDGQAPARSSAASTPRTTTSATSGTPTPACSPRCTSWRPSAARTDRSPQLVAQYDRYAASGEINSTVDDQAGRLAAIKAAYDGPRRASPSTNSTA